MHCSSSAQAKRNYDDSVTGSGSTDCSDSSRRVYIVRLGNYRYQITPEPSPLAGVPWVGLFAKQSPLATLPPGTPIQARIEGGSLYLLYQGRKGEKEWKYSIVGSTPLETTKLAPEASPNNRGQGASASIATPQAILEVSSVPPGADIELDGNFVGSTPSSVGVSPGDHSIKLTKSGYRTWERKLKTSIGTVRIAPDLSPLEQAPAK
jgi:hypothetical protein